MRRYYADRSRYLGDPDFVKVPVAGLLAAHTELYVFTPPGASAVHDVAVTEVSTPHALANTDSFRVGVALSNLNDHPVAGAVRLFERDRLIEKPGSSPARSPGTGVP